FFNLETMNSLFIITPRKTGGIWTFTDEERGLINEPFVGDTNRIIDELVRHIPSAEEGVVFLFSAHDFPGRQVVFERRSPENGGWWYFSPNQEIKGWLCPALFKFFPEAPEYIFL